MSERESDPIRGFFLVGLMLGGAVGAALGLLYAPRPGAEVRRELGERSEKIVERRRAGVAPPHADTGRTAPPVDDLAERSSTDAPL